MKTTPERFVSDFKARLDRACESGLLQAAEFMANEMVEYSGSGEIPFWTGALKASVYVDVASKNEVSIVVGNSYAASMQYGTEKHAVSLIKKGVPTPLGEWAMSKLGLSIEELKAMRIMHVNSAHPFVQESIKRNMDMIKNIIVLAIEHEFDQP